MNTQEMTLDTAPAEGKEKYDGKKMCQTMSSYTPSSLLFACAFIFKTKEGSHVLAVTAAASFSSLILFGNSSGGEGEVKVLPAAPACLVSHSLSPMRQGHTAVRRAAAELRLAELMPSNSTSA